MVLAPLSRRQIRKTPTRRADDGVNKAIGPRGERGVSRKPLRGECRMFSGASAVKTRAHTQTTLARTRLRVHWAPGIPRALLLQRDTTTASPRGNVACERGGVSTVDVIARSTCDDAIQSSVRGAMDCFVASAPCNDETHRCILAARIAPELCKIFRPLQTEGAGNAGCPMHPQPGVRIVVVSMHTSIHSGSTGIIRHPPRNGFTASSALFPGTNCFVDPVIRATRWRLANLTPA